VTTVAAKEIIARYYRRPAVRSYFNSCSNGGREGLIEAQLYPDDFDGLIIGAPWNLQSRSSIAHLWMRRLLSEPGWRSTKAPVIPTTPPASSARSEAACFTPTPIDLGERVTRRRGVFPFGSGSTRAAQATNLRRSAP
jgi:Tannase and feruloyl esterase